MQHQRGGQISIDYIAGALVFFGSIIVLVSSVLGTVPQVQEQNTESRLQLTGWSMSEVLLHDTGYWIAGGDNGTSWHRQPDSAVKVLGLRSGEQLSREKIRALQEMDQDRIRDLLNVNTSFNIELTEYVDVSMYNTFQQGSAPSYINEPSYPSGTANTMRYGSVRYRGDTYHALLGDEVGWHNLLWVSDDWDFDTDERYNLSEQNIVQTGPYTFTVNPATVQRSEGNLLLLKQRLARKGAVPGQSVEDITSIKRFGAMDDNVVRMEVRVWQ